MSDSEATPGPSIHEYLRPKLFAHSSDRLELTETSSSELSKVAEASNPKRINVSSRHPGNEQAIKCNVGIHFDCHQNYWRQFFSNMCDTTETQRASPVGSLFLTFAGTGVTWHSAALISGHTPSLYRRSGWTNSSDDRRPSL